MRRRWVMRDGALVELDLETRRPVAAPYVQGDLEPYKSMRTGEMVAGRAAHREHLKRYDLIEVGNERLPLPPAPGPERGEIRRDIKRELARDRAETSAQAHRVLRQAGYDGPSIERLLKS